MIELDIGVGVGQKKRHQLPVLLEIRLHPKTSGSDSATLHFIPQMQVFAHTK